MASEEELDQLSEDLVTVYQDLDAAVEKARLNLREAEDALRRFGLLNRKLAKQLSIAAKKGGSNEQGH